MKRKLLIVYGGTAVAVLPLVISGFHKLSGQTAMREALVERGLEGQGTLLGILEISIVFLYVFPSTQNIGFFLLNAFLGGAIAIELAANLPSAALTPVLLLLFFWVVTIYKNPDWFFFQKKN